ncbi:casein kinase II beta subunit [Protomyces lactucae-debilis]|uniref:Casein kinase II subunit beta n=1 Tax=Protomyces lactucae-debilis TaxID=2754530 RepID=A0A1Y2FJU8_PROLT|nr:casein kinase II beta subunit [Protomyces lactucae-debilis]ORY83065.1 casein kinase II beta subunit [Protomyces lactucae-debilis]
MRSSSEDDDSGASGGFVDWILSSRGGEFFCDIDAEYMTDRFNLTGLSAEVPNFQIAYDLICDTTDIEVNFSEEGGYAAYGRHLYGMIHARYILTPRGLQKMLEKYKQGDFGVCPRFLCHSQHLLPIGPSDLPSIASVQTYCPHCEDLYTPKSKRHANIDGAYFGTTFPHMLLQLNSAMMPAKSEERYVPKIFGFRVHESSQIHRKQDQDRHEMIARLGQYASGG